MRTSRSFIATVGLVGSATLVAAACGSGSPSSSAATSGSSAGTGGSSNKTIGLSMSDQTSLFYIAEADGVKDAAKAAGYRVVLESANDDSATQINQVNTLVNEKVGALIFTPTDAPSATAGVTAANNAKIPVIGVDERPPASATNAKEVTYIASNSVAAADQECTYMAQKIGGSGDIAIIEGVVGVTAQVERSQGCAQALAKFPNVHVVAQQSANWMEDQAYAAAQTILSAHKGLKAIFAESDAMALGVARAAQSLSYSPYPVIVSEDGFPTDFQAIRAKTVSATEAQQPYHMGVLAVQDAIKAMKGQTSGIPSVQYQPTFLVTQANISQWPAKPALGSAKDLYGPMGV